MGKGLVIEVDGGYHEQEITRELDEIRTQVLNTEGFDVIRFSNDEVLKDAQKVVEAIKQTLINQPDRKVPSFGDDTPHPALSKGEGSDAGGLNEADRKVLSFGEDLGEANVQPHPALSKGEGSEKGEVKVLSFGEDFR